MSKVKMESLVSKVNLAPKDNLVYLVTKAPEVPKESTEQKEMLDPVVIQAMSLEAKCFQPLKTLVVSFLAS